MNAWFYECSRARAAVLEQLTLAPLVPRYRRLRNTDTGPPLEAGIAPRQRLTEHVGIGQLLRNHLGQPIPVRVDLPAVYAYLIF